MRPCYSLMPCQIRKDVGSNYSTLPYEYGKTPRLQEKVNLRIALCSTRMRHRIKCLACSSIPEPQF
jgi:hypothetical protein